MLNILSIIIVVIAVLIYILVEIYKIKKDGLRKVAIDLIVEAEERFELGKNSDKFNYVFSNIYIRLPLVLQLFMTKQNLEMFIEKVFTEVKKALDYQNTDVK